MNDLSIHGQFDTLDEFSGAVKTLMKIRSAIGRAGSRFSCHRDLAHAQVTREATMHKAIQSMSIEERRAWIQWLTKGGPFWEDDRQHAPDDWLETAGELTPVDHAIGESAFRNFHGDQLDLISAAPSDWLSDPISVTWKRDEKEDRIVDVPNHWTLKSVQRRLDALPATFCSWKSLEEHVRRAYRELTLSVDAFASLSGCPFALAAANRINTLLGTLDRYRGCFNEHGARSIEGDEIYEDYFKGDRAWFSDSSDSEKEAFRSKMTFAHPDNSGEILFCPFHGKVSTQTIRIHFTYPIAKTIPLYVVYIGPKITKR